MLFFHSHELKTEIDPTGWETTALLLNVRNDKKSETLTSYTGAFHAKLFLWEL